MATSPRANRLLHLRPRRAPAHHHLPGRHLLHGDVVAITDSTGAVKARYEYDVWGRIFALYKAGCVKATAPSATSARVRPGPSSAPPPPGSTKGKKGKDSPTTLSEPDPATGDVALPAEDEGELQIQGVMGEPTDLVKMNPYRYGGYPYDRETQYYYLRARNYDGRLARFLSQDTRMGDVRNPLTLNRYIYALGNPVNYLDPTGHTNCPGAMSCSGIGEENSAIESEVPALGTEVDAAVVRAYDFTQKAIRYYGIEFLRSSIYLRVPTSVANSQAEAAAIRETLSVTDVAGSVASEPLLSRLARPFKAEERTVRELWNFLRTKREELEALSFLPQNVLYELSLTEPQKTLLDAVKSRKSVSVDLAQVQCRSGVSTEEFCSLLYDTLVSLGLTMVSKESFLRQVRSGTAIAGFERETPYAYNPGAAVSGLTTMLAAPMPVLPGGDGPLKFKPMDNRSTVSTSSNPNGTAVAVWVAPKMYLDSRGFWSNGPYRLDRKAMEPHTNGKLSTGKSQFLYGLNADQIVLDAAAYADKEGLWVDSKARVPAQNYIGVHAETGQLTQFVNVYRSGSGLVHGSPASP